MEDGERMAFSEVTAQSIRDRFTYSPETGEFKRRRKAVGPQPGDGNAGWVEHGPSQSYRRISISRKRYFVHNLIWLYMTGEMPADTVDHVDGNGLNNEWANLRVVTAADNMKNKRMYANNKSGSVGVMYRSEYKRWYAQIGKRFLGSFGTEAEAIEARRAAEIELDYHPNHGRIQLRA